MTPPRLLPVAAVLLAGPLALIVVGTAAMAATGGELAHTRALAHYSYPVAPGPGALAFPDGPPARVTGGFGEESCFACHWDGTENDGVGTLEIAGFPEEYEPGAEYELEISLSHPALIVAGFQLAIRTASGETQAGSLGPGEGDITRVGVLVDRAVQFAHQTSAGVAPSRNGATTWSLRWSAPEDGSSAARLHASTIAGDGDASQMGDHVYTIELESRPKPVR